MKSLSSPVQPMLGRLTTNEQVAFSSFATTLAENPVVSIVCHVFDGETAGAGSAAGLGLGAAMGSGAGNAAAEAVTPNATAASKAEGLKCIFLRRGIGQG